MWLILKTKIFIIIASIVISAEASGTERFNYFNSELFQEANEASNGNFVISPLCVKTALTILTEATGGKTRQELLSTLRLPQDPNQIREISNRIRLSYSQGNKPESELHIANRLWTTRSAHLTPEFNNILINYYGSDAQYVEFSDRLITTISINEWVRRYTNNHIASIIEPGTINPETQLLLTSALYFKGTWLKAFDESSTRTLKCFKVSSKNCQTAIMMENISKYRYANIPALDADVVELPYTDGRLSMLILLPKNEGLQNLQTLSRDLAHRSMLSIVSNLEETEILLQIPKFTIDYKKDLRLVLEKLGIKEIFDSNANFTGVLSGISARVSSVYHNAKIEINEAGTVAAAVTGISITPLIDSSMTTFRADRPFIFTVIDRQTGMMIFAGRVVNPNNPSE